MKARYIALVLAAGCTWSNSLYQARKISGSAAKAEREESDFQAGVLWGQVAVKAESAYARNPEGDGGGEALWLRGRALAHLGLCRTGRPLMEEARVVVIDPKWEDELRLELARCRTNEGDPKGAVELLEPLFDHPDDELRQSALREAGRALALSGEWEGAAERLAHDESKEGRWLNALALAHLGKSAQALVEIDPRLQMVDSMADWGTMIRALSSADVSAADTLVARLMEFPRQTDTVRARWLLATVDGLPPENGPEIDRRLRAILALGKTPSSLTARLRLVDRMFDGVADPMTLDSLITAAKAMAVGDPPAMALIGRYSKWSTLIQNDLDSISPGDPGGDLAMWFHAEVARDSLGAPKLANWFLINLETGWPKSQYIAKALLARLETGTDSAAALRARLNSHRDSPYLAYIRGQEGVRFAQLEDSLDFYLEDRFAAVVLAAGGDDDGIMD